MPETYVSSAPRFEEGRVQILRGAAVLLIVVLLAGFWSLQVARADYYARLADRNRIRTLSLLAPRGLIYDRKGRVLVDSYPSFTVILIREHIEEVQASLDRIARGLNLERDWLDKRLKEFEKSAPYTPIVLKEDASLADIAFVEAHQFDLPELELVRMYRRRYPPGELGAHLFGYVGEASRQEVEQLGHASGDIIGKMGIEQHYNNLLMGQSGQRRVIVDSRGKQVEVLGINPSAPGQNISLTIDLDLQLAAEELLQGRKGALVALDPRTGDILAMASQPTFDPNLFAVRVPAEEWRNLVENPDKPLFNRAIQAALSPGSVFKVMIATAALQEGIIDETFTLQCPGFANHYGRVFRCWKPGGHGVVNLHKALSQSCDVFFYEVGKRLGIEQIARYAKEFGLGAPTGVDLPSGAEASGLVPSPEWKRRARNEEWYLGETISVAIGQGPINTTPLQLAYAIGGIASGGVFSQPRIHKTDAPPVQRTVDLDPEYVKMVTDALWAVVNEGGTAPGARLPGIDLAGKTGTAQIVSLSKMTTADGKPIRSFIANAWFVGFAPRRDPEIIVAVLVEHGEHGSSAAPLARDIIRTYYEKSRPQQPQQVASSHRPATPAPKLPRPPGPEER